MSLANLAAFGGFALLPEVNLDYTILFTSLLMIQIMLMPLLSIIQMLPEFFSAFVSWKRIRDYVAEDTDDEKYAGTYSAEKNEGAASLLLLENASAGWAPDSMFLQGVDCSVNPNDLMVVSGAPGSGKSSFLKAVLGETRIFDGAMKVGSKHVAYCDQAPWFVPEMTIKENILFGKAYNAELYAEVVGACCLDYDFPALRIGDSTVLASNGSPLSGGQRKRVSLARTLYDEDSDLVLFDDIFSGLDAKTRARVATNVFGSGGFLQKRGTSAILCCTESKSSTIFTSARNSCRKLVPSILHRMSNTRCYQLESGALTMVEKSLPDRLAYTEDTDDVETVQGVSGPCGHMDASAPKPTSDTGMLSDDVQENTRAVWSQTRSKSLEAHRLYLKSLGSIASLILATVLLITWIGIEKGSCESRHWLLVRQGGTKH